MLILIISVSCCFSAKPYILEIATLAGVLASEPQRADERLGDCPRGEIQETLVVKRPSGSSQKAHCTEKSGIYRPHQGEEE